VNQRSGRPHTHFIPDEREWKDEPKANNKTQDFGHEDIPTAEDEGSTEANGSNISCAIVSQAVSSGLGFGIGGLFG